MIRTRHFNMLIVQFLQTRETIAADTEMFFFSFFLKLKSREVIFFTTSKWN